MYHILIVDDEKIERNGLKFLLKKTGVELKISEAQNGKMALDYLKNNPVDILLTDVKMPFMDGMELIENVNKLNLDIKILIFSGFSEFEYAKRAMKMGVLDYILKPVDPKEFENAFAKVLKELDKKKVENQIRQKSLDFFKERILYLLVNGATKDDIKKETKGILDINFLSEYHKLILIEFNKEFFGKVGDSFFKDIKEILKVNFEYLNLNTQQSLLFFKEKDLDWKHIATKLQLSIKNLYNENSFIAISSDFNDYTEIPKIMEELEELMQDKFYQTETRIYFPNKEELGGDISQIEEDALMKKMKQDIKMKNINSLRDNFEKLCNKFKTRSSFSQIYVKFIFSNILKDFYDNLPDVTEKELNKEIDLLYRSTNFQSVIDIVNLNIDRLEKVFNINPKMEHREIETIKEYIYKHYNQELSVDSLAEKVYIAPSYLSYLFKKETGQNLSKFIKSYRMEKAKEMLEETHNKIVNISMAVGYPNVSYFCQSFREYFGVSPQKFRDNGENYEEIMEKNE